MKDYAQYKNTFVKAKQSKAISNAIEEIEKYCKGTSGSHEVDRNDGDELTVMTLMKMMMTMMMLMMMMMTFAPLGRGESTQPPTATTDQSDEDEVTVTDQGHIG